MKTAFVAAVCAALVAVSWASCVHVPVHKCVKDHSDVSCTAVKVCEDGYKEQCGDEFCKFPLTCATAKREECKDFVALKEKCAVKKVCKEIKKPCGDGFCSGHEDCVKDVVCKKVHPLGRRLMDDGATAVANAHAVAVGGVAVADASAVAVGGTFTAPFTKPCDFCKKKEVLSCHNTFTCVAKDPCVDVIIKKCVPDHLRPGHDLCEGGFDFFWPRIPVVEKCGLDFCKPGEKCADVIVKKCAEQCGDVLCPYGSECVTAVDDVDCKKFAFLETVCRDVLHPVCVLLSPFAQSIYEPPCKTVFKCEKEASVCGSTFCPAGHKCVVDFVEQCAVPVLPVIVRPVVPAVVPVVPLPVVDPVVVLPDDSSSASSTSIATDDSVLVDTQAISVGDGDALATATGSSDEGDGFSQSEAFDGVSTVTTEANSDGDKVVATGDALALDGHDH